MNKIELRVSTLDFTSTNEHELVVEGIVNDFNWSEPLGIRRKFKERIQKGAFTRAVTRALQQNGKIDFLSEHDPNKVLSSTSNDSLILWEDENKGFCMRAVICPTSWGKDTFQLIKSGIIKSMSFGFKVIEDEWTNTRSEIANRIVKELDLIEVSAVRNPAYLSSVISARGMELVQDVEVGGQEDGEMQNIQGQEEEEIIAQNIDVQQELHNVSSDNNNQFDEMMNKMLQQFETILSNYIPKQHDTESQIAAELPINNISAEENIVQDNNTIDINQVEDVNNDQVVEEEVINEEVEKKVNKSEIDYAIELLSKYKRIQELQK